jgi:uncharacterized protein (UPF0332 family)
LIELEECFNKGLLRKIPPSREKAKESLEKAITFLDEADANLEENRIPSTTIMAYLAMFNSARALLFKDGYREKSHACVARYVEEKYGDKISQEAIDLLDRYRSIRHMVQYDESYFPTEEEAREMMEFAKKFVETVRKIINAP